jgi:TPR repeat protein
MNYHGEGILQDYKEAAKYYHLAADQGHAAAQFYLGGLYFEGEGVPQNYAQAHMWLNIASVNGADDGQKWRDETAKKMSQDDVSKAQDMARVCMASGYQDCG